MDLLESILRTANAEEYIENFRNEEIDAATLKILNNKDLEIIGVHDENIRNTIIKRAENLVIPSEKKVELNVNNDYAKLVLLQISNQLTQHTANLFCCANREDVINYEIKLANSTKCLLNCIDNIDSELNALETKLDNRKKKSKFPMKKFMLISALGVMICSKLIFRIFSK